MCNLRGLAFALLTALVVTSACVDLEEPWNKVAHQGGTGGAGPLGTGGTGGATLAASGGTSGSNPGFGGTGVALDGATPPPPDSALGEKGGFGGAGGQAGLMGTGGAASGGMGGSSDVRPEVANGGSVGTGGAVPFDAARSDGPTLPDVAAETLPDAATETPSDPATDARGDASDGAVDGISTVGLLVYYPCEGPGGASGTTLVDLSGNNNHGTLGIGPPPSSATADAGSTPAWSFDAGKVGNGLTLHGRAYGYVGLPEGLLVGRKEVTFATWLMVSSTTSYQRVFDFGTDTYNFMYLATANQHNTGARFRIFSGGAEGTDAGISQVLEGNRALVVDTWIHLALVLGPDGAALYVDGRQQASSKDVTLRPADLGSTNNNFIGRSLFVADPYLDGVIDEYRIYDRALSSEEIAALAAR